MVTQDTRHGRWTGGRSVRKIHPTSVRAVREEMWPQDSWEDRHAGGGWRPAMNGRTEPARWSCELGYERTTNAFGDSQRGSRYFRQQCQLLRKIISRPAGVDDANPTLTLS